MNFMSAKRFIAFALAPLLIFSDLAFAGDAKHLTINVCTLERNFLPFTDVEGNGYWQKTVKAAAAEVGVNVQMYEAPRTRCLNEIKWGTTDAVFSSAMSAPENAMVFPRKNGIADSSKAVGKPVFRVYRKKGTAIAWDGTQFTGLNSGKVGAQTGLYSVRLLAQLKIPTELTEGASQTLAQLNLGRVAAAVLNEEQVAALGKDINLEQIEALPTPFASEPVYLAISKKFYEAHHKDVEKLWTAIQKYAPKYSPASAKSAKN